MPYLSPRKTTVADIALCSRCASFVLSSSVPNTTYCNSPQKLRPTLYLRICTLSTPNVNHQIPTSSLRTGGSRHLANGALVAYPVSGDDIEGVIAFFFVPSTSNLQHK